MALGIGLAAYRLTRRANRPTERAAYLLALLSPLMVIPSVISVGGLPPSNMRSLGMVPLIFVLVALGVEKVWHWLELWLEKRRNPVGKPRHFYEFYALFTAILLLGGVLGAVGGFRSQPRTAAVTSSRTSPT